MWLLIFVSIYVCASVGGETPVFRKCCSRGYSLIKVSKNEGEDHFDCLDRASVELAYNISNAPLMVGDGVTVEFGLPEICEELRMVHLTSADNLRPNPIDQCYDRLLLEVVNGSTETNIPKSVALTCVLNHTETLPDPSLSIEHIRKCCPKGQSYDSEFHICKHSDIQLESSEEWLVKNLDLSDRSIYVVENGLHCKSDEYSVELSEKLFSLGVEKSSLKVSKIDGLQELLAPRGEWCLDREYGGQGLVARVCTRDCEAFGAYCVRKCCPVGEHYKPRRCGSPVSSCVPNDVVETPFDISEYLNPLKDRGISDVLGIRTSLHCKHGRVVLNNTLKRDSHYLTSDGLMESPLAINDDYCLETFDNTHCPGGEVFVTSLICFIKPSQNKNFKVSFVLITISCVCLALTLFVYCALPELRNLHGRTLICHVSMMLLAFSCLARVQFSLVQDTKICTMLGYGIYFGFMAAFAWLNVMCLDIWWTFGSMRSVQPMRKAGSERRRFLWYSLYAWTIAIIFTLTMFLLDRYPVAHFLDANIGNDMCWFGSVQNSKTDWPHYIFFVIPMGLGTCINLVLFMLTARHCARVKSEVHRMQAGSVGDRAKRRFRVDRAKYVLTGKLWVVMGAGWISELLATLATQPEWLWSIVDLFNELQGVFIFLILIFKPKLYYLIRKRLGLEKPDAQKQGTSSGRTSSTFLSRTISSDERATLRISQGNNVKLP